MEVDDDILDPPPPAARISLATVDDVRLEMARVYREMRAGGMKASLGTKLVWALSVIAKVTEASTFERRLKAIEEAHGRIGHDSQSSSSPGAHGATSREH